MHIFKYVQVSRLNAGEEMRLNESTSVVAAYIEGSNIIDLDFGFEVTCHS